MKKRILSILAIVICVTVATVIIIHKYVNIALAIYPLDIERCTTKVEIDDTVVAGYFSAANTDQEGVYLSKGNGQIQVFYHPFMASTGDSIIVYESIHSSVAYCTYAFKNNIVLLELYYNEANELSFCITQIGRGGYHDRTLTLYQDKCDRMPYITIVDLFDNSSEVNTTEPYILLNYDNEGESRLLLLNKNSGPGNYHTIISSVLFEAHNNNTIEIGRRIVFAGGYGDYIYYQVLYNTVGDPHPDIATFEATGKAVLFRYNIHSEEIERVTSLDNIVLHLNASKNYAIISEYDYDKPLLDSGKVLCLNKNGNTYAIPGVESGVDIRSSRFIDENHVVFYTPSTLYLADLKKHQVYTYILNDYTTIYLDCGGVFLSEKNAHNQLEYSYINYADVFDL